MQNVFTPCTFIRCMKWQTKLQQYNAYFRASHNLGDFDLPFGVDRLLCRNEALRTKDRTLYHDFLTATGHAQLDSEMAAFDARCAEVLLLDQYSVQCMLARHKIGMLQSDIWIDDEDCIFTLMEVPEKEVVYQLDQTLTAVVEVNVLPQEIAGHRFVWLDLSAFPALLREAAHLQDYMARVAS